MNAWLFVILVTLLLAPYLQIVARTYLSARPYAILNSQQNIINSPFWADANTAREINEMCDNKRHCNLDTKASKEVFFMLSTAPFNFFVVFFSCLCHTIISTTHRASI